MIVTILILEHACLFYVSLSKPSVDEALDKAFSQYQASDAHNAVIRQFLAAPNEYSIEKFTEFIYKYRF
jgi:hypothetical protein